MGRKRVCGLLAVLLLGSWPVGVQARSAEVAVDTPCVGLVLGGGGARGIAHVGVLKVLERERIPVCAIAGTSMGAIVGGLYAAGFDAAELEQLLASIDWNDMFVDSPPRAQLPMERKQEDFRHLVDLEIGYRDGRLSIPAGLVRGQKLMLLLRRLTLSTWRAEDFDQLPIRFRAVAADIVTGRKKVFADGDLAVAIRASMSVPGAFAPVRVGEQLLVDGGMADNPRPALYGVRYSACLAHAPLAAPLGPARIVGPLCESGDVLIDAIDLPAARSGDILALPMSGAYHLSMASNYNAFLLPPVYWLEQGRLSLLQRRQTAADLWHRDHAFAETRP